MRQSETDFYALLKRNIPGFWSRIENVVGVGIPDCVHAHDGISGLVELKVSIGHWTYFKVSQLAWITEYCKQGKDVAILIRDDDVVCVVRGSRMIQLERTVTKKKEFKVLTNLLLSASEYMTSKPFHWDAVRMKMRDIHRVSEK